MKIDLPLETWTDVFAFLCRLQLMALVPHFGKKRKHRRGHKIPPAIGNRQFVSFVQFSLHRCGEITLGWLEIRGAKNGHGPIVNAQPIMNARDRHAYHYQQFPLADWPIPSNVKNFSHITLRYCDESVLSFLQELQCNSLLTNVNIQFSIKSNSNAVLALLTNVVPLFTSVNSFTIGGHSDIVDLCKNEYSELVKPMMESARVLYCFCSDLCDEWFANWLYTQRKDGKPRILEVRNCFTDILYSPVPSFLERVKKNFLEAKQSISFIIHMYLVDGGAGNIQSLSLSNGQTNEKLVISKGVDEMGDQQVTILRHPIEANKEWIGEMKKAGNCYYRTIRIDI